MMFTWIIALMLLAQPVNVPNDLSITEKEQPVITINRTDFMIDLPGVPILDVGKYKSFLKRLDKQVYEEPVNAKIDSRGRIIPEQVGYKLNHRLFTDKFSAYFFSNGSAKIDVPKILVYPKVDSELLSDIRVKQIGRYDTYFNASNKNRSHNISLATEAINNYVVFPGKTFSFNKVVGQRTKEKGYLPAKIIVRGEFSEGVGGGICQVSSTLFNAVDRAGVQITQRYSHSKRVNYVPPGRDATVSWYGPDFNFKNHYNQPILIRANAQGSRVTVMVYSSDQINYEPRKIPSALKQPLQEVSSD
ncbi:hypothetical protein FZC66_10290 [Priestia megaterium]|nr:hypothetical protein FZC66_10290 [Priestia megaterium]